MPKVVLADRMGCLKGGVVANVVVPTPAYVRLALHYGFRPDFCEGHDPESKGIVEHLVGYAKSDLVVPEELVGTDLVRANEAARAWCDEVNGRRHTETCAVPGLRLEAERHLMGPLPSLRPSFSPAISRKVDRLAVVRFGGGRYSVPDKLIGRTVQVQVLGTEVRLLHFGEVVATHDLVAPGEASIKDEHYGGARRPPRRKARPRTNAERAICELGEVGEAFIKAAAAAGVTRLASELEELVALEPAHGRQALVAAMARALEFCRYKASDVRSILAAGKGLPRPARAGEALVLDLPKVPTDRSPPTPAITARHHDHHPPAPVRRARGRPTPPQVVDGAPPRPRADAHGQDTALVARGPLGQPHRGRGRLPGRFQRRRPAEGGQLPGQKVVGRLRLFRVVYLPGHTRLPGQLGMGEGQENPCFVGPPGTGKSHCLVALGHAAVDAGYKVRYFVAVELVDWLYRGLADNSVGKVIESILRADLVICDEIGFAPLDDTGAQLLFRFVAAAYERRSLAIASHWPFEEWGHFLPNETTAVSLLDRLIHHSIVVVTDGESFRMREARKRTGPGGSSK